MIPKEISFNIKKAANACAIVAITVLTSLSANAQLYSHSTNYISNPNNVGVNSPNPSATLHITEKMVNGASQGSPGTGPGVNQGYPMLRFNSTDLNGVQHYWDYVTDGSSTLKLKYKSTSSSAATKFELSPNWLNLGVNTLNLGQTMQSGITITPDNNNGQFISLGMKCSNNNWSGKGGALISSDNGSLFFITNDTNSFSGVSSLQQKSVLELKADGQVNVKQKLQVGNKDVPTGAVAAFSGGHVYSEKYVCKTSGNWPDYVFESNYELMSLSDLENYIKLNSHLPEVPSAQQVDSEGVDLELMNKLLLKKVEELTLHLIEIKKEVNELKSK